MPSQNYTQVHFDFPLLSAPPPNIQTPNSRNMADAINKITEDNYNSMATSLTKMTESINTKFQEFHNKQEDISRNAIPSMTLLERISNKLTSIDTRLTGMETKLTDKINGLETRFTLMETQLTDVTNRTISVETKVENVETNMGGLKVEMKNQFAIQNKLSAAHQHNSAARVSNRFFVNKPDDTLYNLLCVDLDEPDVIGQPLSNVPEGKEALMNLTRPEMIQLIKALGQETTGSTRAQVKSQLLIAFGFNQ
ncbi:hypothetical protein SBOR_8730 [Sclerotinia borealis F-4128]|uniref:Uncharacterized protein n=1 Tax=Sclerotinia borealis (strain F-4128) TaxID=1432307 RepID=W9C7P6_SCLBF|nr:hypothetical protein SBOR_8730 [Sclerotinia borealis F-4128]